MQSNEGERFGEMEEEWDEIQPQSQEKSHRNRQYLTAKAIESLSFFFNIILGLGGVEA